MYEPYAELSGRLQRYVPRPDSCVLRVPDMCSQGQRYVHHYSGLLYVPEMAITALWSFWQLLDQCYPAVIDFRGSNGSSTWGFYLSRSDSPVALAQRHGNTILIATDEVKSFSLQRDTRFSP